MHTHLVRALGLVVWAVGLALAGHSQVAWPEAKTARQATLVVHIITEPPFVAPVPGKSGTEAMTGIEADLLRGFVRYVQSVHGVTLTLRVEAHTGFASSFPALERSNENAVALGSISILAERAQRFDFTQPYLPDIEILVSSTDVPAMPLGEDRAYLRYFEQCIALTGNGSTSLQNFERLKATYLPGLQIDSSYRSMLEALEAVPKRPRSLTYVSLPLYLYKLGDLPGVRRRRAFKAVREGIGFMLPKGSSWTPVFNEYLLQLRATDGVTPILIRHLGPGAEAAFGEIAAEISDSTQSELLLSYQEQVAFQESLVAVQARAERQRLLIGFGAFLLALLVVFAAFILRQSRYRKRVSETLAQQNRAIEEQRQALENANAELLGMQEEVVRAEKLAVLGTLVANTAHKLNSPVGAIQSSAHLLQQQLLPVAHELVRVATECPPVARVAFFDLLESHKPQREALRDLPLRERRKRKQALIESLPERLQPEADKVAESLLAMGIQTHEEIPSALKGAYRPAWTAFAQLARLFAAIDNISDGAKRTARFVQLLRLYVSESPRLQPVATHLAPILERLLAAYAGLHSRGVVLESVLDETATSHLNEEWLTVVLQQPLVNALQALRGSGTLTIEVAVAAEGARVVFADTGPGIPKDVMDNLFEPFVNHRQDGEGLGLGLYLVRRTLDAVGGTVEIETGTEGTRVTLVLP